MAKTIQVTWLGHSTFLFTTPENKKILVDPWVENNPACPASQKKLDKVDLILVTHGHFDHIGDCVAIAKQHQPTIIGIYEICHWLQSKGVEHTSPMNKGGTQQTLGVKVTMTHAVHSCGIQEGDKIIYGGEAAGYVIQFSNGRIFYHAGDTAVFGDMALIAKLYKPDTAFLPIGDHFTMSPQEAAEACNLLKVPHAVPMHHGTFPLLKGKPHHLKELLTGSKTQMIELEPGEEKTI